MTLEKTPWAIGSPNVYHSANLPRIATFAAMGGQQGIVRPHDLKVQALPEPGGAVTVAPGGAVVNNGFAAGAGEAYVIRNVGIEQLSITPTTTTARTDLVIVRVRDNEFDTGVVPDDPGQYDWVRFEVLQGIETLPANYSAVALAVIQIPPATSVITNAMIKDLRRVANPLETSGVHSIFPTQEHQFPAKGQGYALCPNQTVPVSVPPWATRVIMEIKVNGLKCRLTQGLLVAGVRPYAGPAQFSGTHMGENGILTYAGTGHDQYHRQTLYCIGDLPVTEFQGETIHLGMAGVMSTGGWVSVDYQTQIGFSWTFQGVAA